MADSTEKILQHSHKILHNLYFQNWVEKYFRIWFTSTYLRILWLFPALHKLYWTRFTYCFLVADRKPTISIACCSLSKSWRRSSSSSILKFCYKEIQKLVGWMCKEEKRQKCTHKQVKSRGKWKGGWEKEVKENKECFINMQYTACALSWEYKQQRIQKLGSPHECRMNNSELQ